VDKPVNSVWIAVDNFYCITVPSQGHIKMASACRFTRKQRAASPEGKMAIVLFREWYHFKANNFIKCQVFLPTV
jgi:hypothetical protein